MSTRVSWIDLLKCFAIYTVVAGHMMSCEAFDSHIGDDVYNEFILAFHMPLFTILSGWFFTAVNTEKHKVDFASTTISFIKKRGIGILLPYVVWCCIWFFVKPLIGVLIDGNLHLSSIIWQAKFFLYDGLCMYGWWFLRGLFLTLILAFMSVRVAGLFTKNAHAWGGAVSVLLLLVLSFTGVIPNQVDKDSLLKGFIYMYPFFWVGYYLRQVKESSSPYLSNAKRYIVFYVIFSIFLLCDWNGITDPFYSMNTSALAETGAHGVVGWMVVNKTLTRIFIGSFVSFTLILLFSALFNKESQNKFRVFCQNIGKETLGIYILQSTVYWSLPKHDILGFGAWGNFLFSLFLSIVIVVVSYYLIKLTSKSKILGLLLWGKRMK